ncbi:MAG: MerR family transcriptional regulator [Gammaproteobacteria bacterium]|nr:MerR family transcriptional regulator [Gammaproteobacteria bacterium]
MTKTSGTFLAVQSAPGGRIPRTARFDGWSIGQLAARTGVSADTLRYYEKIGLLPRALRDAGGRRRYGVIDLARLRFIQRAQAMDFSLAEIRKLLALRARPQTARADARQLTAEKLAAVEVRLKSLRLLRNELKLLLNLCAGAEDGCPILESMAQTRR